MSNRVLPPLADRRSLDKMQLNSPPEVEEPGLDTTRLVGTRRLHWGQVGQQDDWSGTWLDPQFRKEGLSGPGLRLNKTPRSEACRERHR